MILACFTGGPNRMSDDKESEDRVDVEWREV